VANPMDNNQPIETRVKAVNYKIKDVGKQKHVSRDVTLGGRPIRITLVYQTQGFDENLVNAHLEKAADNIAKLNQVYELGVKTESLTIDEASKTVSRRKVGKDHDGQPRTFQLIERKITDKKDALQKLPKSDPKVTKLTEKIDFLTREKMAFAGVFGIPVPSEEQSAPGAGASRPTTPSAISARDDDEEVTEPPKPGLFDSLVGVLNKRTSKLTKKRTRQQGFDDQTTQQSQPPKIVVSTDKVVKKPKDRLSLPRDVPSHSEDRVLDERQRGVVANKEDESPPAPPDYVPNLPEDVDSGKEPMEIVSHDEDKIPALPEYTPALPEININQLAKEDQVRFQKMRQRPLNDEVSQRIVNRLKEAMQSHRKGPYVDDWDES